MLVLEALWFFLPILVANQCPGLAVYFKIPYARVPVASRLLGKNKTIAAYVVASFGAIGTVYAQQFMGEWSSTFGLYDYDRSDLWLVGITIGIGTILGDHIKSFVKRSLGIPPGDPWWPFDQLDGVIGGVALSVPLVGWIGWSRVGIICALMLIIHPIGNYIAYKIGIREVPW